MTMLATKAGIVANGLVANEKLDASTVQSGPFIQFLTTLFQQLLPMLLACIPAGAEQTPAAVLAKLQNLGPIGQWMLRKQIYQALEDPTMNFSLGLPIYRQILAMGASSTIDDVAAAMAGN